MNKLQEVRKKCRYFNRRFCKYKSRCRFVHPDKICQFYVETGSCNSQECCDRHPKECKWIKSNRGCRREDCVYLHKSIKEFKCEGCKCSWKEEKFVVEHTINNMQIFFCLNCEDWIQYKENVFNAGWTLFDDMGFLRTDI